MKRCNTRIFITLAAAAISSVASLTTSATEKPVDYARGRALVTASAVAPGTRSDFVKSGTNRVRSAALAVAPNWRYRFYRGEWWYWMPAKYWTYYRNGNWLTYDPATYQSLVVTTPNYAPYYDNGYYGDNAYYNNGYYGGGYYGNGYYGGYRYYRPYYGPGYSYYRYPGYRYGYNNYGYRPNYYSA